MAPVAIKSKDTLGTDGDATLSSDFANDFRVSPGLPSCATTVTIEAAQPSEEHGCRVDRLGVEHLSSTASTILPSRGYNTPLDDEKSDLHAALDDEMKDHSGEGPLDSWLHSIQMLYTNASDEFVVNKANLPI